MTGPFPYARAAGPRSGHPFVTVCNGDGPGQARHIEMPADGDSTNVARRLMQRALTQPTGRALRGKP
jgi:hypothetical protein